MKQVYIKDISERDFVDSAFLVRSKTMAMAKNGKPYMTLKLMDRSGEVEGRVWDRVDDLTRQFAKDDFVHVQAKASVYMGKMQLVVQGLTRLEEEAVDLADFLPVAEKSAEVMVGELKEKVAAMEDPHLKQLMGAFMADDSFMRGYCRAPAAKSMHHVFLGGLLEHSLAVASLVEDVGHRYPGINRDLLVTGALLHDIGKVAELCYERGFDYTDQGKLLGHIVIGVEMVEEKLQALPDFPIRLATLLKHLLLSHHGQYEYGSPKRPKTLEAVILNFLDDLDSKINGVRSHIDKEGENGEAWTSYHRLYDRYFFKDSGSEGADEMPAPPLASGEPAAVKPRSAEVTPAKKPARETRPERRGRTGFTLGDQLGGKSLDLFSSDEKEKK